MEFSFGVFQEYFTSEKTFGNASKAALGAIGTVALGLEYALAMIVILIAQQWHHRIPLMMWICLGICCASLVGASFATQLRAVYLIPTVWLIQIPQLGVAHDFTSRSMLWNWRWRADIAGPGNPESIPNMYGFLGITKGVAAVIGPVVAASLHRLQDSAIRETYSGYGFRDVTI
ncbi:unnamed protein product, partial [Rhizoctonia solani]